MLSIKDLDRDQQLAIQARIVSVVSHDVRHCPFAGDRGVAIDIPIQRAWVENCLRLSGFGGDEYAGAPLGAKAMVVAMEILLADDPIHPEFVGPEFLRRPVEVAYWRAVTIAAQLRATGRWES